jgi:hypothetical protein
LIGGQYVLTAAHVVESALRSPSRQGPPSGRVRFDLPMRSDLGSQSAEIVWWVPPGANDSGDLAGLSVVGPTLRDVEHPVLAPVSSARAAQTVWIYGFPSVDPHRGRVAHAELTQYTGEELVQLNRADSTSPSIDYGYSGAGVIAQDDGRVFGIARAAAGSDSRRLGWMCPTEKVQWTVVTQSLQAESRRDRLGRLFRGLGSRPILRSRLLDVVDTAMEVPALAESQQRHTLVSELPLDLSLSIPRSANDRADVASLFWICAQKSEWRGRLCERLEQVDGTARLRELAGGLGE